MPAVKRTREQALLDDVYQSCGVGLGLGSADSLKPGPALPVFLTVQKDSRLKTANLIWRPKGASPPLTRYFGPENHYAAYHRR